MVRARNRSPPARDADVGGCLRVCRGHERPQFRGQSGDVGHPDAMMVFPIVRLDPGDGFLGIDPHEFLWRHYRSVLARLASSVDRRKAATA